MNEYGVSPHLPRAPFSVAELTGIVLVIGFQVTLSGSLPVKLEVRRRIKLLTRIGEVLQQQLTNGGRCVALPLDAEEVKELLDALQDFCARARVWYASDPQWGEVISAIENWHLRLSCIVAEHQVGVW